MTAVFLFCHEPNFKGNMKEKTKPTPVAEALGILKKTEIKDEIN